MEDSHFSTLNLSSSCVPISRGQPSTYSHSPERNLVRIISDAPLDTSFSLIPHQIGHQALLVIPQRCLQTPLLLAFTASLGPLARTGPVSDPHLALSVDPPSHARGTRLKIKPHGVIMHLLSWGSVLPKGQGQDSSVWQAQLLRSWPWCFSPVSPHTDLPA